YFFVRAVDAPRVTRIAASARVAETSLRTFAGEPVVRVEMTLPGDVPPVRKRLGDAGVECLEADVRFAYRYLIDRGIRGGFTVDGPFERRPGVGRVYQDPVLTPADFAPTLRILSFDIETSIDGKRLYSVAMAGAGGERVLIVGDGPVASADVVPDERALVAGFVEHLKATDPDVLTGWNVCDFDLPVLQRAAHRHGLRFAIGRTDDELDLRRDQNFTREA